MKALWVEVDGCDTRYLKPELLFCKDLMLSFSATLRSFWKDFAHRQEIAYQYSDKFYFTILQDSNTTERMGYLLSYLTIAFNRNLKEVLSKNKKQWLAFAMKSTTEIVNITDLAYLLIRTQMQCLENAKDRLNKPHDDRRLDPHSLEQLSLDMQDARLSLNNIHDYFKKGAIAYKDKESHSIFRLVAPDFKTELDLILADIWPDYELDRQTIERICELQNI